MLNSNKLNVANIAKAACAGAFLLAATGCSWQQGYYAAQGWQMNSCQRTADPGARSRCEASANVSYDEYRRVRQSTLR